jgi:hypothetical protein
VDGKVMYRLPKRDSTYMWHQSIPRPVLALFISYKIRSPIRLIPVADFLRVDFELTLPKLILKDASSKWVVSIQDNSDDRLLGISLLAPLEQSEVVPVTLQKFGAEFTGVHFASLASTNEAPRSREFGTCVQDKSYSYERV